MIDSDFHCDHVLNEINPVGLFQILTLIAVCYSGIVCGVTNLQAVYISYTPEYRCNVGPLDNRTLYPGLSEEEILNHTTPHETNGYSRCYRYGFNLSECTGTLDCVNKSINLIPCDNGYEYDRSLFTKTTVTQFNLVCDRRILFDLEASIYMIGWPVGALIFGPLADRVGRRNIIIGTGISISLFNGLMIYPSSFLLFAIWRFMYCTALSGCYIISFVYALEVVGGKWRATFGTSILASFPMGYTLWSVIAYLWRDWHQMQLATFVISLPFILFSTFLPESPRWLFSKKKNEEGKQAIRFIAKVNGTIDKINENLWSEASKSPEEKSEAKEAHFKASYCAIFKPKKMRLISLILIFSSGVHSFVYYGVSFGAGNLPGNLFINNLYGGCLEIIASLLGMLALKYIGRVAIMVFCLFATGICLLASTILLQYQDVSAVTSLSCSIISYLGKAVLTTSYCSLYPYKAEVYPTDVRGSSGGILNVGAGVSAALYPFILALYNIRNWLPGTIFSILAICASLVSLNLPETRNEPLLNTVTEAEGAYKRQGKLSSKMKWYKPKEGNVDQKI